MSSLVIHPLYDEATATMTYVVAHRETRDAVVIDSVLDYDPASSKISMESLEKLITLIQQENLNLLWSLETHAHADHLSAAHFLKKQFPELKTAIGERIQEVQGIFKKIYNLSDEFVPDGRQFDRLLKDGERLEAGSLSLKVIATPGHTPACVSYLIEDCLFTGDALFMPDTGTGRCDFPAGSAEELFNSISQRLYSLPDSTRVWVGHDYRGNGNRGVAWQTTIGEEKKSNIQLMEKTAKDVYVQMRKSRDATLSAPRLLLPSLQINIEGGRLPQPETNGVSYLKLPLSLK